MDKLTIELPESISHELDTRHITPHQLRAFVVEAIDTWLRVQPEDQHPATSSRFSKSATNFAEQLVRENRELFEQLAKV
jgi:hypothetical protein